MKKIIFIMLCSFVLFACTKTVIFPNKKEICQVHFKVMGPGEKKPTGLVGFCFRTLLQVAELPYR